MSTRKETLIQDIENLLNTYEGEVPLTHIDPNLLSFMDEETLINIIQSVLSQQERVNEDNQEWLEQFKKYD